MADRPANPDAQNRHTRDATPREHGPTRGIYMMGGWREQQILVTEGHYRCPDCRRADTLEANALRHT
jgi:hypothetical protein